MLFFFCIFLIILRRVWTKLINIHSTWYFTRDGGGGVLWHFNRVYYSSFVTCAFKSIFFTFIHICRCILIDIADKYNFHFVFQMPWNVWWHMNCVPSNNLFLIVSSYPGNISYIYLHLQAYRLFHDKYPPFFSWIWALVSCSTISTPPSITRFLTNFFQKSGKNSDFFKFLAVLR